MHWSLKQSQIQYQHCRKHNTKTSDEHKYCTMQPFDSALGGTGRPLLNGVASMIPLRTGPEIIPECTTFLNARYSVADDPLGRTGSCLRPGMVQRPVRPQGWLFRHYFRVCEKKNQKKCFIKSFSPFFRQLFVYFSRDYISGGWTPPFSFPLHCTVLSAHCLITVLGVTNVYNNNSNHSVFHIYAELDVPVFVKHHKLVQCLVWIESGFSSYCITFRPTVYIVISKYRNPPLKLLMRARS